MSSNQRSGIPTLTAPQRRVLARLAALTRDGLKPVHVSRLAPGEKRYWDHTTNSFQTKPMPNYRGRNSATGTLLYRLAARGLCYYTYGYEIGRRTVRGWRKRGPRTEIIRAGAGWVITEAGRKLLETAIE